MAAVIGDAMAATRSRVKAYGVSDLLLVGTVAGLFAGFLFILANMYYTPTQGLPAVAPFFAIGTIFYRDAMPEMTPAYAIVGLITHFSLSIAFGLTFALVLVPLFSHTRALIVGAILYGGVLYVLNYQILGRLVFKFFDPSKPDGTQPGLCPVHPPGYLPAWADSVLPHHGAPTRQRARGPRRGAGRRRARARNITGVWS